MTCQGIEAFPNEGLISILQYPTTCDHHFYAKMMGAIFVILTLILFNKDRDSLVKTDIISSLGVSGLAVIFLSLIGTMVGFIQNDVFLEITVFCLVFVVLWMFKR